MDGLTIHPHELHWLSSVPSEQDLCAHGGVVIRRGEAVLLDDSREEWALSAAALFLLRAVFNDHTPEAPVCEQLIPHCGHAMYATDDSDDVTIVGCGLGRDWRVRHDSSRVVLEFDGGIQVSIPWREWRDAVVEFSDAIEAFYSTSAEKSPTDEHDSEGFASFRREWSRRRTAAGEAASRES